MQIKIKITDYFKCFLSKIYNWLSEELKNTLYYRYRELTDSKWIENDEKNLQIYEKSMEKIGWVGSRMRNQTFSHY